MNIYKSPWELVPNKLPRSYQGGREIDKFRCILPAVDDGCPEAWVGSDTRVFNAQKENPDEGCSWCILPDGRKKYLYEAISENPEAALGERHIACNGKKLAILVKLLDAKNQLGLQCHPTRAVAAAYFNSPFGKAESWYVIGVREDVPEPPYVYLGFKEGVTRQDFVAAFSQGDISGMENLCHKVQIKPGDLFNIEAGLPHALGAGCFVVEVQESSDVVMLARPLPLTAPFAVRELNKKIMLESFIFNGYSLDKTIERYRIIPENIRSGLWGAEKLLIGPKQSPYFSFTRIDALSSVALQKTGLPAVVIVIDGAGQLSWDGGTKEVRKADEIFIPFGVQDISVSPYSGIISLIVAYPPGVE